MIIISILAIIILLILLTFVWPPDSPWSPWWRTDKSTARAACRLARVSKKDVVYELGSGDGEFVLTAGMEFGAKATGIEIDATRYWISQIKKQISKNKNATFIRDDFKKIKLSDASVVYFYLVPKVIERILPKLKRELTPGTRIVSYKYKVSLPLSEKKGQLYLYIM